MAPRLNLNNLWVQKRNPDTLLLSLESPTNVPLQVRQRRPYGEKYSSTGRQLSVTTCPCMRWLSLVFVDLRFRLGISFSEECGVWLPSEPSSVRLWLCAPLLDVSSISVLHNYIACWSYVTLTTGVSGVFKRTRNKWWLKVITKESLYIIQAV